MGTLYRTDEKLEGDLKITEKVSSQEVSETVLPESKQSGRGISGPDVVLTSRKESPTVGAGAV